MNRFTSSPGVGGTTIIQGGSAGLSIDTNYNGISTSINSRTYYFGQNFINGVSNPEVQKYSGNIIHVDNRPSVTRSSSPKRRYQGNFAILRNHARVNQSQRFSIF